MGSGDAEWLNEFGVESDLGVVGEQLGDGATSFRVTGRFVESFLGGPWDGGCGRESDLGDREACVGLCQSDCRLSFDF